MVQVIFMTLIFLLHQPAVNPNDLLKKGFQEQVKGFGKVWKDFADKSLGTNFPQVIHKAPLLLFQRDTRHKYGKNSDKKDVLRLLT